MNIVTAIDQSAAASFVRDTLWIYPTMLTLHGIGLAFAVGVSAAIDLRVLGAAPGLTLPALRRWLPVFYIAFAVNAVSGVALVLNNPAKWLIDPIFYLKVTAIAFAALALATISRRLRADPITPALRGVAALSLVLWVVAITTGRLLAYGFFR